MKLTQNLLKQHIGYHFKKHWRIQGRRKPLDTGAEAVLSQKGIPIYDPKDVLQENKNHERIKVVGLKPKPLPLDENHPNWHARKLLTYRDNNVLLEGITQAKIITNTVELKTGLPNSIALKDISKEDIEVIKGIILGSHVFDAEQKKLPKIKDPERPAFNFPRVYGITNSRAYKLITSRLLQFIESRASPNLVRERYLLNDLFFSFPFEKYNDLIQFQLKGDTLLTAPKPLPNVTNEKTDSIALPDIYPIKPTITLVEENIYELENIYPLKPNVSKIHPHTLFIHYDREEVKNLFEEEVTDSQVFGRSLLKTFTVAASYARQRFGNDTKLLPHPITLQCVHSDGRLFHFGVLQLNTLDLEEGSTKNVWYQTQWVPLFGKCCYSVGKPTLEEFNVEAVKILNAFYNNV